MKLERKDTFELTLKAYRNYIQKVCQNFNQPDHLDDLQSEAQIGLWKAFQIYNPEKGTFHQIAQWYIKCSILDYLNNFISTVRLPIHQIYKEDPIKIKIISTDNLLNQIISNDDSFKAIGSDLNSYINKLDDRHSLLITMRYNEDKSLKEIGDQFGITKTAVQQQLTSAIRNLRSLMAIKDIY